MWNLKQNAKYREVENDSDSQGGEEEKEWREVQNTK